MPPRGGRFPKKLEKYREVRGNDDTTSDQDRLTKNSHPPLQHGERGVRPDWQSRGHDAKYFSNPSLAKASSVEGGSTDPTTLAHPTTLLMHQHGRLEQVKYNSLSRTIEQLQERALYVSGTVFNFRPWGNNSVVYN